MRNRVCSNFLILINTLTFGECGCYDWQPQTKDKQAREADQWDAVSWHHQAFCTLTSSRPISLLHLPRVVFADTVTPAVLNQALLISPNVVSNFLQKPSADFFTHEMCSSQEFYWKLFLQQTRPNRGFLSFFRWNACNLPTLESATNTTKSKSGLERSYMIRVPQACSLWDFWSLGAV